MAKNTMSCALWLWNGIGELRAVAGCLVRVASSCVYAGALAINHIVYSQ
jgi:hypothetical protein